MDGRRGRVLGLALCALLVGLAPTADGQSLTSTITGRATDSSGALLPGVTVTISSPAMIGGERTTVTDGQGAYQLTLLPPGEYRVSFGLQGFATLTVEKVQVPVGATSTVNGKLELAGLQDSVTVVSETPAIDVKATNIATNWDQEQLEALPYARGIRGLTMLVPGLTSTQFDVGGNTVGGSTTTGANNYGRSGDELARFEGAVWDQHFGDYDSYEQVQASTAAKGAGRTDARLVDQLPGQVGRQPVPRHVPGRLPVRQDAGHQRHPGAARSRLLRGQQQVHPLQRLPRRSRRPDRQRQAVVLRRLRPHLLRTADSRLRERGHRRAGRLLHHHRQRRRSRSPTRRRRMASWSSPT